MFGRLKTIIKDKNEKKYINNLRRKIKNTSPTIISNNCIAGVIYHNLGIRFLSPTINLYISGWDYIYFVENLEYYLSCELIERKEHNKGFPVGVLTSNDESKKDIEINFLHYKTFKEAKEAWYKRLKRVNYDNIFFIYEYYEKNGNNELLMRFNNIKYNKHIILHKPHNNMKEKWITVVNCYDKNETSGTIFNYDGITGKRYLDKFDYVSFLNENSNSSSVE